jgi:hypothetical protein
MIMGVILLFKFIIENMTFLLFFILFSFIYHHCDIYVSSLGLNEGECGIITNPCSSLIEGITQNPTENIFIQVPASSADIFLVDPTTITSNNIRWVGDNTNFVCIISPSFSSTSNKYAIKVEALNFTVDEFTIYHNNNGQKGDFFICENDCSFNLLNCIVTENVYPQCLIFSFLT